MKTESAPGRAEGHRLLGAEGESDPESGGEGGSEVGYARSGGKAGDVFVFKSESWNKGVLSVLSWVSLI